MSKMEKKQHELSENFFQSDFMGPEEGLSNFKKEQTSHTLDDLVYYTQDFLNDALTGIIPGELVVVGADTGIGKTEFVLDLAYETAIRNKKVYLFPLEGTENEAIARLKWRLLSREYFKKPDGREWNYKKFLMNGIDTSDLEEKIDNQILNAEGLNIFKNANRLSIDGLINVFGKIDRADLVVLDHLHYFSLDESKNEYSQVSQLVRTIKDLTKIKKIPIVLVSHLRKKDRFRRLPDNEDFHGSSNIAKEANTCIMIFRDPDSVSGDCSTLFRITKSREGALRYMGKLNFSLSKRVYEKEYRLVTLGKEKIEEVNFLQYPSWAKLPKENNETRDCKSWSSNY